VNDQGSSRTNAALWVRLLALVAMVGGYLAFLRGNDAEATAIFDAGGDAGMWDLGIVVATILLLPGGLLLLVSLAMSPRRKGSAVVAGVAGVVLLAPTALMAATVYPPDKETSEGSPLAPAQWAHVSDLYLVAFVLMAAAGTLLLVSAVGSPGSPGEASTTPRST